MIDPDKLIEALEAERAKYNSAWSGEELVARTILTQVINAVEAARANREE